ncbi:MAG: hypothetical protein U9M94_02340 [Patescibacteria group bacterium]|nr:hypothetical protein [Patescibacteria group bacterium]
MARKNENNIGFGILEFNGKKKIKIERGKKYKLPKHTICSHVYAGELCFGRTEDLKKKILKTNRGTFFKNPDSAVYISFPCYKFNQAGNNYGIPVFTKEAKGYEK